MQLNSQIQRHDNNGSDQAIDFKTYSKKGKKINSLYDCIITLP